MPSGNAEIVSNVMLQRMRDIKAGNYRAIHCLGKMYLAGNGITKNLGKAIELYEQFYKTHRSKGARFNEISFLIELGDMYLKAGDKSKAAETYFTAGMEIIYMHDNKAPAILKLYKIEQLIKKTGCTEYML